MIFSARMRTDESASFPLFDWLRFVLASVVALGHEGIITWEPAGNFAVQIFFALSGWLIGGILLRTDRAGLPRFFFNRSTRIWIPYLVAAAAIYLLGFLRDGTRGFEFLIYDLTFTHNWFIEKTPAVFDTMVLEGTGSHFWSISVEEQFYLAAPLLIIFLPWGRRIWTWIGVVVLAYAMASWYIAISLGVLAAVAQQRFGDWHQRPKMRGLIACVGAAAMLGLLHQPGAYAMLAPLVAVAVVLLSAISGERGRIGEFLGGMSYPLYLNHWIGMFAANALAKRIGSLPPALTGWTAYAIALLVGAIAYVLIDRNIQKYRGALFTPARGTGLGVTAYSLLCIGVVAGLLA